MFSRVISTSKLAKMSEIMLAKYKEANEKILFLKKQVAAVQNAKKKQAIETRKSDLLKENAAIQQRIQNLKSQLGIAEVLNGKRQIAMPYISVASSGEKSSNTNQTTAAKSDEKPAKQAAKEEKKPKPAKTNKKATPKADDGPVDVSRLDFRVGCIVTAKKHPDADTLYVEDVDTGEDEHRTVVSGLVKQIPIDQMQNRMVVLLMNLKPAKMRGVLSQAMVMCSSSPDKVEIIDPPKGSVPGDRISFKGYIGDPDKQLNPKKKVWERIQPDLNTDGEYVACYKGVPFEIEGKGVCKVQTMAKSSIK